MRYVLTHLKCSITMAVAVHCSHYYRSVASKQLRLHWTASVAAQDRNRLSLEARCIQIVMV